MLVEKILNFFRTKEKSKMPLLFFNTLTKSIEQFSPIKQGEVKMYNCGPTVYDRQHIGNLSAAVFADTIRKVLEYNGYKVKQSINITDFGHLSGDNEGDADSGDDRMTKGLKREKMKVTMENMRALATKYMDIYLEDIRALNLPVDTITFPRASDYISAQIAMIKSLEEKGYAYRAKNGVYFDTIRFKKYGALGGITIDGLREGARVAKNEEKHNGTDFVLWKSDDKLGWDSPWGKGFPGWHIECSAMIRATLGEQIDIHTGGIEHIPIHHNNEIAQSECATGKSPFSRFWMHRAHVQKDDEKLAKSTGNVTYLSNIRDQGFYPLALRYWFLTSHYRSSSNFTFDALRASQQALLRLAHTVLETKETATVPQAYKTRIHERINDDLDTPGVIAAVWEAQHDSMLSPAEKSAVILEANKVLGLSLDSISQEIEAAVRTTFGLSVTGALPDDIQKIVDGRALAREEKKWDEADRLRDELAIRGYAVKDTAEGQKISRT